MNKNIELRLKYNQQVIDGESEKAWETLNEIWTLDQGKNIKRKKPIIEVEKELIKELTPTKIIVPSKFKTISDLSKIKGVGKRTVEELEDIYGTFDNLLSELEKGVNLKTRDDIEDKIKKELNI